MESRVGFMEQKQEPRPGAPRAERVKQNRRRLERALNLHTTVAFVGAGCSAPLGHLTWPEFTREAIKHTHEKLTEYSNKKGGGRDDICDDIRRIRALKEQ